MAGTDDDATPAGWYPQPDDPSTLRWWDGDDWTDDTMPAPEADRAPGADDQRPKGAGRRRADERQAGPVPAEERAAGRGEEREAGRRARPAGRSAGGTRSSRPVVTFGEGAAPAVEIELEPVGGPGPRPRGPGASPGDVARMARMGEVDDDWSRGSVPAPRQPSGPRQPSEPRQPRPPAGRRPAQASAGAGPGPRGGADRDGREPVRAGGPPRRSPSGRAEAPGARSGSRPAGRAPGHSASGGRGRLTSTPSPDAAAHALRILARAAVIAVVVAIVWVGYSKLVAAEPDRARTLSKDAPAVEADEDAPPLSQVVLTLSDLPRGWSSLAAPTNAGLCEGRIPETVIVPTGTQSATFTQDDTGAVISSTIDDFADEGTAKAFLDLAARVIDSCRDASANGSTTHLTPLKFPKFGDDTFAAALASETPEGSLRGELVYLRKGTRVAAIASIQLSREPVDEELLELLVGRVSTRLSRKARITGTLPDQQPDGEATLPGE